MTPIRAIARNQKKQREKVQPRFAVTTIMALFIYINVRIRVGGVLFQALELNSPN